MKNITRNDFLKTAAGALAAGALGSSVLGFAAGSPVEGGVENSEMDPVEVLTEKEAIREQICKYCLSMDRLDRQLGYQVFTEDSELDYGPQVYQGNGKGFVDKCLDEWHPPMVMTAHRMTNIIIDIDSASQARTHTYGLILMLTKSGEDSHSLMLNAVRYGDLWRKEEGQWRIAKRTMATDWNAALSAYVTQGPVYSVRSTKEDMLYDLFPEYR